MEEKVHCLENAEGAPTAMVQHHKEVSVNIPVKCCQSTGLTEHESNRTPEKGKLFLFQQWANNINK